MAINARVEMKIASAPTQSRRRSELTSKSTRSRLQVRGITITGQQAKERPAMRKSASRKKTSLLRKIVLGPVAPIVAAIIGGLFSLTSTVVSRVLPPKQVAVERAVPAIDSLTQPRFSLPTAPRNSQASKRYEDRLGDWLQGKSADFDSGSIGAAPQTSGWADFEPVRAPSIAVSPPAPAVARQPTATFESTSVNTSHAHAEVKAPAQREAPAKSKRPNLTYGVWTIFAAKDARGTPWSNSTLKITSQHDTSDGLQVAGFLDWRAGKRAGREFVVGNYEDKTRTLYIEGRTSGGNDRKLALSACSARLSEDERRLTNGTWGSASAHRPTIPGRWEAWR
jgi:hypothetical protein